MTLIGTASHAAAAALQTLRRRRRNTTAVLLTLAVGIGGLVAVFTVIRPVLFAPLPFRDDQSLVVVEQGSIGSDKTGQLSAASYLGLARQTKTLESTAALQLRQMTLSDEGEPIQVSGARVTPSMFAVLGVRPILGRAFRPEDAVAPAVRGTILTEGHVAVLSHALWSSRFGSRRDVVGRTVRLNEQAYEIIGVLPERSIYPAGTDVWVPLAFGDLAAGDRGGYYLRALARVKADIPRAAIVAELATIATRVSASWPPEKRGLQFPITTLRIYLTKDYTRILWTVFLLAGLIVALVCGNVVNMLLADATARRREVAVRAAIGASDRDIMRQFTVEGLILGWLGAVIACLVAALATRFIVTLAPPGIADWHAIAVDAWSIGFALGVGTLVGLLFGWVPSLYMSRTDLTILLADAARGTTGGMRSRVILKSLVTAQLALAVVLLISTGLLVRSYVRLRTVDLGFRADNLLTVKFSVPSRRYPTPEAVGALQSRILAAVSGAPGIHGAAIALRRPVVDPGGGIWFRIGTKMPVSEPPNAEHPEITFNTTTPGYFSIVGIPLVRGRDVASEDRIEGAPVVVVNSAFARAYLAPGNPLGQHVILTPWPDAPREVVGVVGDVRQGGVRGEITPAAYVPAAQIPIPDFYLVVRGAGEPNSIASTVRDRVRQVDHLLPLGTVRTMNDLIADTVQSTRFALSLVASFGVLAILLAGSGVYAVTSFEVAQRIPEVGIRAAVGATPLNIVTLFVRRSMQRTLIGSAIGAVVAIWLGRSAAALLFETSATDLPTLTGAVGLLIVVSLLATVVPIAGAVRRQPADALARA
jgi:putative ABC transport system permease protein